MNGNAFYHDRAGLKDGLVAVFMALFESNGTYYRISSYISGKYSISFKHAYEITLIYE